MIETTCSVPGMLAMSVVIPILKKSSLDQNVASNYRPISLSSTFGKILELLMMPPDNSHYTQYGFREGRSTSMACSFLNDIMVYCKSARSPLYICSLDAEKCFDSIWHDGLFYKLINILPLSHWLFLYQWYQSMSAIVKWNGCLSEPFKVLRGTKQGSILSPVLFNIFIDELLVSLSESNFGVRIGNNTFNSFAYADDISLISLNATDLQNLIDVCYRYSTKWRFNFNPTKTKYMVAGKALFITEPKVELGKDLISRVEHIDVLGTTFSSDFSTTDHLNKRIQSSRRAMYSLVSAGCSYPGLSTDAKVYMWKTIGRSTLTYNMETLSINKSQLKKIESVQGTAIKRMLGIPIMNHHSNILQAVNVTSLQNIINNNTLSLWRRIFTSESPTKLLCAHSLAHYITSGKVTPGTLLSRLLNIPGVTAINSAFYRQRVFESTNADNEGVIDSIRYLVHHDNFIKPYDHEHMLVCLFTKSF